MVELFAEAVVGVAAGMVAGMAAVMAAGVAADVADVAADVAADAVVVDHTVEMYHVDRDTAVSVFDLQTVVVRLVVAHIRMPVAGPAV